MARTNKSLPTTLQTDDSVSIDDVCELLAITSQGVYQDKSLTRVPGRRGRFHRDPVIKSHNVRLAEFEQKLERMRAAARRVGVEANTEKRSGTPSLDNDLLTKLLQQLAGLGDLASARADQALAQVEIDRLKSEVRRANKTITTLETIVSALQALVKSGRPAEDLGLDDIP